MAESFSEANIENLRDTHPLYNGQNFRDTSRLSLDYRPLNLSLFYPPLC